MNSNSRKVLDQLRTMKDRADGRKGVFMASAPINRDLPDDHVQITYSSDPDEEEITASGDVIRYLYQIGEVRYLQERGPTGPFELVL